MTDAITPQPPSQVTEIPPPVTRVHDKIMAGLTLANLLVATTMLILTVKGVRR